MMDMEKIRQMAREQGVDLAVQGLVCLPCELRKFIGSIKKYQKKGGGVLYNVCLQHKDFYLSKTLSTEAEAEQYIRGSCVKEGLPIKNRFIVFADRVEVELTGNKLLICNYEDLYLVETHTWCCSNGYAATNTGTNLSFFHNMAMKHLPSEITVDHINRNGLDNRKSNLCLVNQKIQSINQCIRSNNKSGVTGVNYKKKTNFWTATWNDADGDKCSKGFSSKKCGNAEAQAMAIKHCQRMIWSLPHYREALQLNAKAQ